MRYDVRTGPEKAKAGQRAINVQLWLVAVMLLVAMVLVASCAPVHPTTPAPMADVPPAPQSEPYNCTITGDNDVVVTTCRLQTPTATPTPEPAFYYFWCTGDARCSSGQYRVYWDREQTMLRCALPVGSKVDLVATGLSGRVPEESEELAWVVTGADAGNGKVCEGWTPKGFLRAAE